MADNVTIFSLRPTTGFYKATLHSIGFNHDNQETSKFMDFNKVIEQYGKGQLKPNKSDTRKQIMQLPAVEDCKTLVSSLAALRYFVNEANKNKQSDAEPLLSLSEADKQSVEKCLEDIYRIWSNNFNYNNYNDVLTLALNKHGGYSWFGFGGYKKIPSNLEKLISGASVNLNVPNEKVKNWLTSVVTTNLNVSVDDSSAKSLNNNTLIQEKKTDTTTKYTTSSGKIMIVKFRRSDIERENNVITACNTEIDNFKVEIKSLDLKIDDNNSNFHKNMTAVKNIFDDIQRCEKKVINNINDYTDLREIYKIHKANLSKITEILSEKLNSWRKNYETQYNLLTNAVNNIENPYGNQEIRNRNMSSQNTIKTQLDTLNTFMKDNFPKDTPEEETKE